MILRPYQTEAIDLIRIALRKHRSVVYVLPTGAGKTVIAAEIARRGHERGSKTLFLVHRRELVDQARQTLREACPEVKVAVEAAGHPSDSEAHLHVGMVQSLVRREDYLDPQIVEVDEAHHARAKTWEKVLARWPKARRIGFTATPERKDRKGLGKHFKSMIMGPSVRKLVDQGFLAPSQVMRLPLFDLKRFKKDANGDYNRLQVSNSISEKIIAEAASIYTRYFEGKQTIFFGVNRQHSRDVAERLRDSGVIAQHIDALDLLKVRKETIDSFRTGDIQVLCNVGLIDEGFDAPSCEVVMIGYPTRSIVRYLQMCGRMMRPGPNKTGMAADLGGTSHELGLPDEDRVWSLEDGHVKSKKSKISDYRTCDNCHVVYPRGLPFCSNCGERPTPAQMKYEEEEVQLEIARKRKAQKRAEGPIEKAQNLKRKIAIAMSSLCPESALLSLARENGYHQNWVYHILKNARKR